MIKKDRGTREIVSDILRELANVDQTKPIRINTPRLCPANSLPIIVSNAIFDLIHELTSLRAQNDKAPYVNNYDDIHKACKTAIGVAISENCEVTSENETQVFETYRETLDELLSGKVSRSYLFGVRLPSTDEDLALEIGCVKIQHRKIWLREANRLGYLSSKQTSEVAEYWLKDKKDDITSLGASITNATYDSHYILSLTVEGFTENAGYERALFAARISIAILCLLTTDRPETFFPACQLANDYPSMFKTMAYLSENSFFDRKKSRPYINFNNSSWLQTVSDNKAFFDTLQEVINFVASAQEVPVRNELLRAFTHSLYWFYKGCNESVSSVAVAYLGACLDALGDQNGTNGIKKRVTAILDRNINDPVLSDGSTLKSLVKAIYCKGRNSTFHGSNEKLLKDWSPIKSRGIVLCHKILEECLLLAANDTSIDCISKLNAKPPPPSEQAPA